ncbi:MAG: UDP-N-acetylmuramate:L-alanyl-gamma-D-glutamyl-meso-diaminopimelate ligase [Myxococcales bacterium]|nr:UDP-N-acetylmuramate:L-alanyl-gamma-D-glutamyl-meso-diaminopimelate ligase [Myxococcales bacterium]
MHIHVVAVAGTGMGALAGLLRELGHDVSGSDVSFDPPMGPALDTWGVRKLPGFDARNLEPKPDLVVIGNVCRQNNPEAVAAMEGGLRYTHIAGALREFVLSKTSPLVVAGTHGKTTTSAMAAWLLDAVGREPGFLIGGLPKNFAQSFRAPRARTALSTEGARRRAPFVIEGDEYDTAFFEKTAKFLHYSAEVAIITSIEHDHIDIYPTLESYLDAFRKFVAGIPESGLVVAAASDPLVVEVVNSSARAPVAWYALEGEDTHGMAPHWLAAPAEQRPEGTTFDLFAGGVAAGRFALRAPGRHNLKNALGALAACAQGYGARLGELGHALARFEGVRRRQDLLGEPGGVFVYDDFAHHPTAVRETLAALRQKHTGGRLLVVFEPRSATACRNLHQHEYVKSFDLAHEVHFAPLGRDNLGPDERLDTGKLAGEITLRGPRAEAHTTLDAIVQALAERAERGDVVALLSNGAFGGIHDKLLAALTGR